MGTVIYSMGHSLDGYITGPDGRFDWSAPDEELFRAALAEVRGLRAHLLGRNLYEAMVYWDDADDADTWGDLEREFAEVWCALPKIVFSSTLTQVRGANTRLATDSLVEELTRLRDDPDIGEIAIGGGHLAAAAAAADLIDEYHPTAYPVIVGGGTPYFPVGGPETRLELLSSRAYANGVIGARYRVRREPDAS